MPDPIARHLEVLADALATPGEGARETVQCCHCGRFVSLATAHRYTEYGDYGTVHSVEFACPSRCDRPGER